MFEIRLIPALKIMTCNKFPFNQKFLDCLNQKDYNHDERDICNCEVWQNSTEEFICELLEINCEKTVTR